MTLEKAIKVLEDSFHFDRPVKAVDLLDAKKLGIEALEHILWQRRRPYNEETIILLGETKE